MQSRYLETPQNLTLRSAAKASIFLRKYKLPMVLMFFHAPLGLVMMNAGSIAAVHAYAVVLFGIYWAIQRRKSLEKVALIVAYIVSAEVLWRMVHAPIYWEFGKYAAGLVMITALAVRGKWKLPSLPLAYFVFLLPACFLTLMNNDFDIAKDKLSFNMSGPFLLFISCWFFSQLKVNWLQLRKILFWLIIPLFSVAVTTLFYTVTEENIQFTGESMRATSGGFGPNQVSAMLGLGVFVSLVCYLLFKNRLKEKYCFGLLAVFFAAQSIMTFSRGGIYNAAGGILAILIFQMQNAGKGIKQILVVAVIAGFFMLAIFPRMNEFTGGALQKRFENTDSTGRSEIAAADFQIFAENPAFGVGVGEAYGYREKYFGKQVAAHTEFTRVIAEHGIFGIFSLLTLAAMAFFLFRRQKTSLGKAVVIGFIVWSSLFMLNTGMRLAAPAFIWSLSFLAILSIRIRKRKFLTLKKINKLETYKSS